MAKDSTEIISTDFDPIIVVDAPSRSAAEVRALSLAGLLIIVLTNAVLVTTAWIPELAVVPGYQQLVSQLSPLAAFDPAVPWWPETATSAALPGAVLLLGASIVHLLMRHTGPVFRPVLIGAAAAVAIAAIVMVIVTLVSGDATANITGLLLIATTTVLVVLVAVRQAHVASDSLPSPPRGARWLIVYLAVLPLPLAVGRALQGQALAGAGYSVSGANSGVEFAALLTPASLLLYLVGATAGVVVWATVLLLPPWQGRSLVAPAVLGGLAIGATVGVVGPYASSAAAGRAQEMAVGAPDAAVWDACSIRHWPADPAQTFTLTGEGCTEITSYSGFIRIGGGNLNAVFENDGVMTDADGNSLSARVVSAVWGYTVVAVAASPYQFEPNSLYSFDGRDGRLLWSFQCPGGGHIATRFVASESGDDPATGAVTAAGEAPGVIARCGEDMVRLDPATGALL